MATFVMLTSLSHAELDTPGRLEELEKRVMQRIADDCPEVEWQSSFAVLGPYDYVDIFRAPDVETATRVATIVRTFGHADTEIWAATEWGRFKEMIRTMPAAA